MGLFEDALLAALAGAGEGAVLVSEERALHQTFGQRAAIDGDEGFVGPVRAIVDGLGEEFLAGAAFADEDYGGLGFGRALPPFEDLCQGAVLAHDVRPVVFGGPVAPHLIEQLRALARRFGVVEAEAEGSADGNADSRGPGLGDRRPDVGFAALHHFARALRYLLGRQLHPLRLGIGDGQPAAVGVKQYGFATGHLGDQRQRFLEGFEYPALPVGAVLVGGGEDVSVDRNGKKTMIELALDDADRATFGSGFSASLEDLAHQRGVGVSIRAHGLQAAALLVGDQGRTTADASDQGQRLAQNLHAGNGFGHGQPFQV